MEFLVSNFQPCDLEQATRFTFQDNTDVKHYNFIAPPPPPPPVTVKTTTTTTTATNPDERRRTQRPKTKFYKSETKNPMEMTVMQYLHLSICLFLSLSLSVCVCLSLYSPPPLSLLEKKTVPDITVFDTRRSCTTQHWFSPLLPFPIDLDFQVGPNPIELESVYFKLPRQLLVIIMRKLESLQP